MRRTNVAHSKCSNSPSATAVTAIDRPPRSIRRMTPMFRWSRPAWSDATASTTAAEAGPRTPRSSGFCASTWCNWMPPLSKASRDPGHVQAPYFRGGKPDLGDRLVPVIDEVRAPVPQRQGVVRAQVLLVQHLETHVLGLADDPARAGQLPVGEDVAIDESARRRFASVVGTGDAVIEQQPTQTHPR